MKSLFETAKMYKDNLGLKYEPVGIYPEDEKPKDYLSFKNKGNGCIAPLIFKAASGKTVVIDEETTGYPCSAFYIGYQKWIFPGIEHFLSQGPMPRKRTGKTAADFRESQRICSIVCSFRTKQENSGFQTDFRKR